MITGLCQQLDQVIPVVVLIKPLIKPFEQYDHLKTDGICTTVNYIIQIHSKRRKLAVFVSKCLVQRVSVLLILIKTTVLTHLDLSSVQITHDVFTSANFNVLHL